MAARRPTVPRKWRPLHDHLHQLMLDRRIDGWSWPDSDHVVVFDTELEAKGYLFRWNPAARERFITAQVADNTEAVTLRRRGEDDFLYALGQMLRNVAGNLFEYMAGTRFDRDFRRTAGATSWQQRDLIADMEREFAWLTAEITSTVVDWSLSCFADATAVRRAAEQLADSYPVPEPEDPATVAARYGFDTGKPRRTGKPELVRLAKALLEALDTDEHTALVDEAKALLAAA